MSHICKTFSKLLNRNQSGRWLVYGITFLLVYIVLALLAGGSKRFAINDWRGDLYADKSGYFVYLPATFIHGFYQENFPDSIEFKLGHGFGFEDGKLRNKYTCGVAILTTPFFLAAHLSAVLSDNDASGFTDA